MWLSLVQRILDLAAGHSVSLGYRWKLSKCAVIGTDAALAGPPLVLYDEALPVVEEFTYLGMPFRYKGLHAPGILSLRSTGAVKTMALLNSVGVNRNGFSLLLREHLHYTRLDCFICENPLYQSLPAPQDQVDCQLSAATATGRHTLLRVCRSDTARPNPILYLPLGRIAHSRLVRWHLGRFTNMREECPCMSPAGAFISRDHFLFCRALDPNLIDVLPPAPPGVHRIDHALNCLPTEASAAPPPVYWPDLLNLLYAIDCIVHPLAVIAPDPDPASLWYSHTG